MVANAYPRTFVPADVTVRDFAEVEPLYRALIDRPIDSPGALRQWLDDVSELYAVVDEVANRRYIDKSRHTEDGAIEREYLRFVQEIEPRIKPLFFQIQKRFLDSPYRGELSDPKHRVLAMRWQAEVDIFREANVPLETRITTLVSEFDKLCGAMTVKFQGREETLQQMARFLEEPDRATREQAYRLIIDRRLADRERIDDLFDQVLPLRQQIATNAQLADYRAYCWKQYKRFDYTPQDCLRFADAIERTVVPLVSALDADRKKKMGLAKMRPWDLSVDPLNRAALRPFPADQTDRFIDKTQEIVQRLSPELAEDFASLRRNDNLDLASRPGKQPGGYQATLEERRQPFIFMNAAGLQDDVRILLHEGGHAFHSLAARSENLVFLRSAPMEFCEVASMSMEALGCDHYDVFYPQPSDAARAKRHWLEGVIRFFPWMATIDLFQHWIYTHPNHTRAQRSDEWMRLLDRFGQRSEHHDWSGFESSRQSMWQRQIHLFHAAFYYVEYGIAMLGALQVWMKAKHDPHAAIANYRAALALGGTRPLAELFSAAGIRFDFSEQTLRPLMNAVHEEWQACEG